MKRLALILAASWLVTVCEAKAGELDSEYGGKAKVASPTPVLDKPSSELDEESPAQACGHRGWRRRFFGFGGYGFGFPGYGFGYSRGYYGFGFGYSRGFGFGRGFGYGRRFW